MNPSENWGCRANCHPEVWRDTQTRVTAKIWRKNHSSHKLTSCCCLVAQLCLILCSPMDCSLPGFSVHAISQARILEWVCHLLLLGMFPTQVLNLCLLHLQVDSILSEPPGKWDAALLDLIWFHSPDLGEARTWRLPIFVLWKREDSIHKALKSSDWKACTAECHGDKGQKVTLGKTPSLKLSVVCKMGLTKIAASLGCGEQLMI